MVDGPPTSRPDTPWSPDKPEALRSAPAWSATISTSRREKRRVRSDKGMATLWAVAAMGVTWTVGLGLVTVAGARVARHRAQAAADLTALAVAAQAVLAGQEACERGAMVATANRARLVRCAVVGPVADVVVTMEIDLPPLGVHTVTARARAEAGRTVSEVDHQAIRGRQAAPAGNAVLRRGAVRAEGRRGEAVPGMPHLAGP